MNSNELLDLVRLGEDSKTQFKEIFNSPDALAAEIAAFANTRGGRILVGVTDKGEVKGLDHQYIAGFNQMVSNVCFQKIDPSLTVTTENIKCGDQVVVVVDVPMGPNKFYIANGSDVWVKVGADKRRARREEMQRLLQESARLFADEQVVDGSTIKSLDLDLLTEFVEKRLEEKVEQLAPHWKES